MGFFTEWQHLILLVSSVLLIFFVGLWFGDYVFNVDVML